MNGSFNSELLAESKAKVLTKKLGVLARKIFNYRPILEMELAGEQIIRGLLDTFVKAMMSPDYKDSRTAEGKLYELVSRDYRFIFENYNTYPNPVYNRLQLVTDYICGMTDSYALSLYQKLKGIKVS